MSRTESPGQLGLFKLWVFFLRIFNGQTILSLTFFPLVPSFSIKVIIKCSFSSRVSIWSWNSNSISFLSMLWSSEFSTWSNLILLLPETNLIVIGKLPKTLYLSCFPYVWYSPYPHTSTYAVFSWSHANDSTKSVQFPQGPVAASRFSLNLDSYPTFPPYFRLDFWFLYQRTPGHSQEPPAAPAPVIRWKKAPLGCFPSAAVACISAKNRGLTYLYRDPADANSPGRRSGLAAWTRRFSWVAPPV